MHLEPLQQWLDELDGVPSQRVAVGYLFPAAVRPLARHTTPAITNLDFLVTIP